MKKKLILAIVAVLFALTANAQKALKKVYNENINPIEQIDQAVSKAKSEGKFVICQVGGNSSSSVRWVAIGAPGA